MRKTEIGSRYLVDIYLSQIFGNAVGDEACAAVEAVHSEGPLRAGRQPLVAGESKVAVESKVKLLAALFRSVCRVSLPSCRLEPEHLDAEVPRLRDERLRVTVAEVPPPYWMPDAVAALEPDRRALVACRFGRETCSLSLSVPSATARQQ
jgi:hypothetical protein